MSRVWGNYWGIQCGARNSLGLKWPGREYGYQGRESYGKAALREAGTALWWRPSCRKEARVVNASPSLFPSL